MKQTVKDIFAQCPVEKIVDYVMEKDDLSESEREEITLKYTGLMDTLLSREPIDTGFVFIGIPYGVGGKADSEVTLYKKDELLSKTDRDSEIGKLTYEEVDALSDEETDRIALIYPVAKKHAYEYALWDEVLGYEVFSENVEEYGLIPFASEIAYKMTYFSFDEEELAEIREAFQITMGELDKVREMTPEEQEKAVFSADRSAAYFSFQDNRSFDEKETERILTAKKAIKDKIIEFKTVMEYIDKL